MASGVCMKVRMVQYDQLLLIYEVEVLSATLQPHKSSFESSDIQSRIGSTLGGGPLVPLCVCVCSRVFHLFKKERVSFSEPAPVSSTARKQIILMISKNYFLASP